MNLKQVANALGVSTATISNAFNRPDQLSAKLRERILTESAKLGYHGPNLAARTLRRGESDVIGVMLSDSLSYSLSDPVASQLLQGIADVLVEKNKHMLLLSSHVDNSEQRGAESLPDGFILYGTINDETYERILRTGKPLVVVDFDGGTSASVNIDNQQGAYQIANLAIGTNDEVAILGLRLIDSNRVCRLTQDDIEIEYKEISRDRLAGFFKAAKEVGQNIPADAIWNIPLNTPSNAEIAAREALTRTPRPSVLLCMSDVIALSAIRVAKGLGLRVPEDVSITGFDGIPEAERSTPALSTVCQQSIEKGKLAATMLLSGENKQVVFATRVVERDSIRSR
ncbi:LacI family DNA-binding transcriptional regulator [Alteromonas flava]|uniref:LacI family DNA-binding transcriptional regulator n=1 Tax=Alteromonas flava TaxID=2048003 RepID=UPI000C2944B7|nr:LacI family DNA-binding transcriptional regulator [Alteromonas flava]